MTSEGIEALMRAHQWKQKFLDALTNDRAALQRYVSVVFQCKAEARATRLSNG